MTKFNFFALFLCVFLVSLNQVAEFDRPGNLLAKPDSMFGKMVAAAQQEGED